MAKTGDAPTCPAPWLDEKRGYLVDWLTQVWVRATGKTHNKSETWLDVPFGNPAGIGEAYFDSLAQSSSLNVHRNSDCGLVTNFQNLTGPTFDANLVSPEISRFYEETSKYELDLWSEWCGFFKPFGWMISFIFSRRLQQLNLPQRPLDSADGITSELVQLCDAESGPKLTGWLRTYRKSRKVIYVGFYSHCNSGDGTPLVRVAFPLPNGCALVLMRPEALPDGSLMLRSEGKGQGGAGFYFLVDRDDSRVWVRHVRALTEYIHVHDEGEGNLSAEHVLLFWGRPALKMKYGIRRITTS